MLLAASRPWLGLGGGRGSLRLRLSIATTHQRRRSSVTANMASSSSSSPALVATDAQEKYSFGPWPIAKSEVFARTLLSFAFVNLKPLVDGHVLVSPLRPCARFGELEAAEVADMMQLAQRVAGALERHYGASAATLAVQDGPAAGQTVPHVHVHVLPRRAGDFERNDQVYDDLEAAERSMAGDLERRTSGGGEDGGSGGGGKDGGGGGGKGEESPPRAQRLDLDVERVPRTREEMAAEAAVLRALFPVE